MPEFDFEEWLSKRVGDDFGELIESGAFAANRAIRSLKEVRSARARQDSVARNFTNRMGQFLSWLHNGARADGTSDADWEAYGPVRDSLIQKGQWPFKS